jgi:RIO kinase 1
MPGSGRPVSPTRGDGPSGAVRTGNASADRREPALNQLPIDAAADHFIGEGLITEVIRIIRTGKEASVHLCRANRSTTGEDLLALKLYHPLDRRDFRDESLYRDGEWIKERRVRVALEKRTRYGRSVQSEIWVGREWETLSFLSEGGVAVPRPVARSEEAILMTYVGDEADAAPQLRAIRPTAEEAQDLLDQTIKAIEMMLYRNVIHGDLSAYNVLVWDDRITVIDLPQAIDPRKNRHAKGLLDRDVARICDHLARHGAESDARTIADDLYTGWEFVDLIPEELRVDLEI